MWDSVPKDSLGPIGAFGLSR